MLEVDNFYDQTEVHVNVTVQVLINSKTGRTSIAWSDKEGTILNWCNESQLVEIHDPAFVYKDENSEIYQNW